MLHIGQTIRKKSDNSLWVYLGCDLGSEIVDVSDELGERHQVTNFRDNFTYIADEFGQPVLGCHARNEFFGKIKPLQPDLALKIHLNMTEEEKASRRAAVIRDIMLEVDKGIAEIDAEHREWGWPFYNLARATGNRRFDYDFIWQELEKRATFHGRVLHKYVYLIDGKLYAQDQRHILARVRLDETELASLKLFCEAIKNVEEW